MECLFRRLTLEHYESFSSLLMLSTNSIGTCYTGEWAPKMQLMQQGIGYGAPLVSDILIWDLLADV